jgi:hypothetical protein
MSEKIGVCRKCGRMKNLGPSENTWVCVNPQCRTKNTYKKPNGSSTPKNR